MTKFIDVSNDTKEVKKETVFTHEFSANIGWKKTSTSIKNYEVVKYLGNCSIDGHMFCAYEDGTIDIFKGIKGDEFN